MRFTEEMSVPQWKQALLHRQQRKREEKERKAREEEEKRRAKLPAWKRHAEQPKTVIFIDKHNNAKPVNLSQISDPSSTNNNSSLANGTATSIGSGNEVKKNDPISVGTDDTDGAPSGVSEEHCTSVHDNPFLKLEKKKRRAPPPPKTGSSISVIATNVPAGSAGTKSTNSNNTVSVTSDSTKTNHIQQNGPSLADNQMKASTKLPEKKNSAGSDVKKTKAPAPKIFETSGNSTNNQTKGAVATKIIRKSEDNSKSSGTAGDEAESPKKRRASIVELRSLFGDSGKLKSQTSPAKTNSNNTSQSNNQSVQSTKAKSNNGNSGLSESKSASQAKASDAQSVSAVKLSNSSSSKKDESSAPEKSSSVKNGESKKSDANISKTKTESKSLPDTQKEKLPLKKRPSEADMPASEIISLTNEGPLRDREGHLKRASSVFEDEEHISLESQESPRSPTNRRLKKYEESSKSGSDTTVKKRAPGAPQSSGDKKVEEPSESTSAKKEEEPTNTIAYPKNFRKPDYEAPKEEVPYPTDFRKASTKSSDKKPQENELPDAKKGDTTKDKDASSSKLSNSTKKSETIDRTVTEKKQLNNDSVQNDIPYPSAFQKPTKEMPEIASGEIPYPSDFRKPKSQASSKTSSGQKDIVKPSELMGSSSSSSSSSSKDSSQSNDSSGSTGFLGFKLRKTKKPESNGITVITSNDSSKKPTVDNNANRSTSSLIAVGEGGGHSTGTGKKKAAVKKFEKVEMIGYNSPTNKPSALKTVGKDSKRNVQFNVNEEELFEYLSEGASIIHYDQMSKDNDSSEEGEKRGKKKVTVGNSNGYADSDDDDEEDGGLKTNPIKSKGGFQNLAATNLSAMDMLLGRGPREEPKEPPKPAPPPEPEQEPESDDMKPEDGDLFSSAGQGTAALLF